MRYSFTSKKLEQLFLEDKGAEKFPPGVIHTFKTIVNLIAQIPDERSLYDFPAFHTEKLRGDRKGQYSIRLNKQFRLCFEVIKDPDGNIILLLEIVDYH
jgi:toxin HigB-1